MNIVYVVYREDNTMVFNSQVLEYLKLMKHNKNTSLIVFRNHVNFFKKNEVESKISKYVDDYVTFPSLPPLSTKQLDVDAIRMKRVVRKKYKEDEQLLIMCRGELATYIASKAFSGFKNCKILFDNRGLPVEEIEMGGKKSIAYRLNKSVKYKATIFSKDHSDIYSFVTNNLREYLIKTYNYSDYKPHFIIPTLHLESNIEAKTLEQIKKNIFYNEQNFYVTYMGSVATWQNISQVLETYSLIKQQIPLAKLLLLTNGTIKFPESMRDTLIDSIIVKSVPHHLIKYYLNISQLGLVLRSNSIVNKVAAPTKIAEYLSNDLKILYKGEIGVLKDLIHNQSDLIIDMDESNWLNKIIGNNVSELKKEKNEKGYKDYFDMEKNQKMLIEGIEKLFNERNSTRNKFINS